MNRNPLQVAIALAGLLHAFSPGSAAAAELKILLPLGRVAYQTNEWIDVSVVRGSSDNLKSGQLALVLTGADGSTLDLTFPVQAAAGKPARATEHFHLNGYLLRPGKYTLQASADGASATTAIDIHSHLRQSTFKTIDWGSRASKHEQATLGEDSMGFNLMLYAYGGIDVDEMIRGGLDYMRCCSMGGWHYMDLRRECDWSDPYVLGGGIARVSQQVFKDRINPNCLGQHFYDEPLLAEVKDPKDPTGKKLVRYGVPAQERSFQAAFGKAPPKFEDMDFSRPADTERWMELNRWRLLLLEAAWKLSCFSVEHAQPDYLSTSQNQWGWHAFNEGYYFNVNRPFPITSRHAWYDYKHGGDFAPSLSFEFGRIRELSKPNWFLPMWGCGHDDLYRAEQYLSFSNNVHGLAKPPDLLAHRPSRTHVAQAIVESNKTMARLGTIFDTLPVTRGEVAVLYSMSHNLHEQTRRPVDSYRGNGHFQHLLYLYLASKVMHIPIFPAVEEDLLDGSLARHHKVVLLAGIDYLDAKVIAALEAYAAHGGAVLISDDSQVQVKGSAPFHFPPDGLKLIANMDRWAQEKEWDKWNEGVFSNSYFKAAKVVAEALQPKLAALGIKPVLECDQPGVIASRQAMGDMEYLFAVNASPDFEAFGWYHLRPVQATLGLPADGRPVYDAIHGGLVESFQSHKDKLTGSFRFGPGQMRVFARTARPIGGVQILTPLLVSDFTATQNPIRVEINAVLVDQRQQVLCGPAPLHIEVIDPMKVKRYDLYRSTDRGMLRLTLPLAANDPSGEWTVLIQDLLSLHQGRATFTYQSPGQCPALAGATRRAVLFGRDRENIFRFFRTHQDLAIIKGSSAFHHAAAQRLAESLDPWDIRCKIIAASEVKRRELTSKEKPTWVDGAGAFDVRGPVVLLGNPDDNPLIRHLRDQKFLPYGPEKDQYPGRGRGLLAWQRDGLAYFGRESVTLIADDEAGMNEAVGTAYEIAAGLEPLTPRQLPDRAAIQAVASALIKAPAPQVAWQAALPDRIVAMRTNPGGVVVLSADGTLRAIRTGGKVAWEKTFEGGEAWSLETASDGRIAVASAHRLHVLNEKGNQILELNPDAQASKDRQRQESIRLLALAPGDGRMVIAWSGYVWADKTWQFQTLLSLLDAKGEKLWSIGGLEAKTAKPLFPERCRSATFCADGKKVLVVMEKKALLIDAARGTIGMTIDGAFQPLAIARGDQLLLGDGDSELLVLSPGQEKIVGRLDCGKAGPVSWAPASPGLVVGTEADGAIRLVKAWEGKLGEQSLWKDQLETKIVKKVAVGGNRIAVTYWGGTLRLFDLEGKLLAEYSGSQDISSLVWDGSHWIIGLADGRLLACPNAPK